MRSDHFFSKVMQSGALIVVLLYLTQVLSAPIGNDKITLKVNSGNGPDFITTISLNPLGITTQYQFAPASNDGEQAIADSSTSQSKSSNSQASVMGTATVSASGVASSTKSSPGKPKPSESLDNEPLKSSQQEDSSSSGSTGIADTNSKPNEKEKNSGSGLSSSVSNSVSDPDTTAPSTNNAALGVTTNTKTSIPKKADPVSADNNSGGTGKDNLDTQKSGSLDTQVTANGDAGTKNKDSLPSSEGKVGKITDQGTLKFNGNLEKSNPSNKDALLSTGEGSTSTIGKLAAKPNENSKLQKA